MKNFFTFNGQSSLDFGVTISGGGTFDSPARSMEAVSVPGRNGDLMVDNGRYDNVEITYQAFIAKDFRKNFDAFRAWMLSNPGYHRLEDTYHPTEFREAAFISSLNPEMVGTYCRAGEFEITFNCKPQRFLKTGEEQITFYPCQYQGGTIESGTYYIPRIPVTSGETCSIIAQGMPGPTSASVTIQFLGAAGRPISQITGSGVTSATTSGNAPQAGYISVYFPVSATLASINVGSTTYEYINGGIVFRNRTQYTAKPMIQAVSTAYGGGDAFSFTVNDTVVSVSEFSPAVSGALTTIFDCENDDAYYNGASGSVSINNVTAVTEDGETAATFPTFPPGDSMIYTDLSNSNTPVSKYIVTPRWWTI